MHMKAQSPRARAAPSATAMREAGIGYRFAMTDKPAWILCPTFPYAHSQFEGGYCQCNNIS